MLISNSFKTSKLVERLFVFLGRIRRKQKNKTSFLAVVRLLTIYFFKKTY